MSDGPEAPVGWVDGIKYQRACESKLDFANQIKSLKDEIRSYVSAVGTCQKKNTDEWLEYLCERSNKILDAIGERDRMVISKWGNCTFKSDPES